MLLLLHGLTASGDFFGARYDTLADHAQLVIPDLLGFGRSLDENRVDTAFKRTSPPWTSWRESCSSTDGR